MFSSACRRRPDLILLVFALAAGAFLRFERARAAVDFGGGNYYALGLNLQTQGVLAFPANPRLPSAYRAPLYPSFIAALLPGEAKAFPRRLLDVQALLGTLAIAALYLLGRCVHSRCAGALAATAYAFNADQIAYGASLEIEHFYSLLLLSAACALVYWFRRPSKSSSWVLGLIIGISLSCRSTLFLFPPFLAAACLIRPGYFPGNAKRNIALVILSAALTLSPWIVRNAVQFHAFIPFERYAAACNLFTASEGMVGTLLPSQAQQIAAAGDRTMESMDEDAKNRELFRRAAANILARPASYLGSTVKRAVFLLGIDPWMWGLSLSALWFDRRQRSLLPLALLAAYFFGIHSLMSVEGRYAIPLVPLLLVLASCALASVIFGLSRSFQGNWRVRDELSSASDLEGILGTSLLIFGATFGVCAYRLAAECRRIDLRSTPDVQTSSEGVFPSPTGEGAQFFNDRGVQRFLAGNMGGAAADFRQASRVDARLIEPHLGLAAALSRQGRHQAAARACAAAGIIASAEDAGPAPRSKERHVLLTSAFDCCAHELRALGRPVEARFFTEASRRSTALFAARLRSLADSPLAESSRR